MSVSSIPTTLGGTGYPSFPSNTNYIDDMLYLTFFGGFGIGAFV